MKAEIQTRLMHRPRLIQCAKVLFYDFLPVCFAACCKEDNSSLKKFPSLAMVVLRIINLPQSVV
jgi:hypothetical protein